MLPDVCFESVWHNLDENGRKYLWNQEDLYQMKTPWILFPVTEDRISDWEISFESSVLEN